MTIELIGSLDYKKVEEILKQKGIDNGNTIDEIVEEIKKVEKSRHSEIVSSAGALSRTTGDIFSVLNDREQKDFEKNNKFVNFVIGMGHYSITDHDYFVFGLKDVSVIVEQFLIEERFASFTVKSRREADFSKEGFYIPNFHITNGGIHPDNHPLQETYKQHMKELFEKYSVFKEAGIKTEDARFILPYCFHSTFIMGFDGNTLIRTIIKLTKTKYSKIPELKELGEKLYEIAKENMPYILPVIDKTEVMTEDEVDTFLASKIKRENYKVVKNVKLLNSSQDIDDQILIAAIIRRYQYNYQKAKNTLEKISTTDPNFKLELMKKIAFKGDRAELSQVNFEFQVPVSNAIKTHLLRHRTHNFVNPDFVDIDLTQYITPPAIIEKDMKYEYDDIYKRNKQTYDYFKGLGVTKEDLIYFNLSGNLSNFITNMDGLTLSHILALRECNKAQWETRDIAHGMHKEINKREDAKLFTQVIGPTCETQRICNEGKECCGKVFALIKKDTKNQLKIDNIC